MEKLTENDNAGAGNVTENDNAGAENGITGAEDEITGAEGNTDGAEILMAKAENSLVGDENNIAGADSSLVGAEDNLAGTVENTEIQQGHNNDSEVINSEKRWPGWPGESVFRILVPSHKVGGIIGRKGEFIKKICEESKARIKIIEAPQGAPERAVMVSAKEEQDASISPAMDGLLRIHKRVVDGLDGEAPAPQNARSTVQTRMLVGASQAGTLIGRHGATIKSIQEASSCIVRVVENVPPFALHDDKIVEIQGQPTGVHKALELVASHLRKFLVDRSVIPLFESQMSRPIPEMQPNMPPPPEHWGHHQGLPPNGGGGFGGNPQFMPPRSHDNFYRPPEMPPFEKPPHHGISAFGRDVPPMGGYTSSNQHGQPVTQHMQVPLSYADAVIGAAGANISYIRRASGATITIQETVGIPGEMTVEINGTATQIQTAQQLVQNFMAEVAPPAQNAAAPVDPYGSSYGPSYSSYSAPQVNAGPAAGPTGGYGASYGAGYGY